MPDHHKTVNLDRVRRQVMSNQEAAEVADYIRKLELLLDDWEDTVGSADGIATPDLRGWLNEAWSRLSGDRDRHREGMGLSRAS
jgi:hypothetical protein